jgi:hypothetical protein
MRHVVANETDDDGVPDNGGGTRESFEEVTSEMSLAFSAEFAET